MLPKLAGRGGSGQFDAAEWQASLTAAACASASGKLAMHDTSGRALWWCCMGASACMSAPCLALAIEQVLHAPPPAPAPTTQVLKEAQQLAELQAQEAQRYKVGVCACAYMGPAGYARVHAGQNVLQPGVKFQCTLLWSVLSTPTVRQSGRPCMLRWMHVVENACMHAYIQGVQVP